MIAFVYRCPATGLKVQGHLADELLEGERYEAVTCTACGRVHLVNPKSGRVLEPGSLLANPPRPIARRANGATSADARDALLSTRCGHDQQAFDPNQSVDI